MKTIVVPMDFSNEALSGLNFSIILANKIEANILMIHVISGDFSDDTDMLKNEHHLTETKFKYILNKFNEKIISNLNLSYSIKEGKIFEEITKFTETFDDPLVVLSTHGQSGWDEWFIGGNSYKITSHSKCPVFTVGPKAISTNIQKIVIPLDISFQTREKVPFTVELAQTFNSEIHLLSVRLTNFSGTEEKLQQYTMQVETYIKSHDIPCIVEHLQGDNLTDLSLEYALSIDADLISIMMEQEKSNSNLLLGSYAHQMINKAIIPVLLIPNFHLRKIS